MALIKEVLENILLVIQEKESPKERDNLLEGIIEELAELGFTTKRGGLSQKLQINRD